MKHEATHKVPWGLWIERLFVMAFTIVAWTAVVSWIFDFGLTGIVWTTVFAMLLVSKAKGCLPGDPNW